MNVFALRRLAKDRLRGASISPRSTTLVYLLIVYAVLIPYNLFTIGYTYRVLDQASGFDTISKLNAYNAYAAVAPMAISLFTSVLDSAYQGYMLRLSQDRNAGIRALFDSFQLLGKLIWLTVQILLFTSLWMCLFIIPGFIAAYRYRFAYFILFDCPELSASQALNLSKQLTEGRKMQLFQLDLSFLYFFISLSVCNVLINLPYFLELPNSGMQTDIRFYLLGTCAAFLVQFLFLPHHRASLAAAYLDACEIDPNIETLSE